MTSNTHVPFEHIVFTDFDGGEGVLVDLNTKKYYQLNETAALVWRALEQGKSREAITSELTAHYDVSAERADASVERILRTFVAQRLVRAG